MKLCLPADQLMSLYPFAVGLASKCTQNHSSGKKSDIFWVKVRCLAPLITNRMSPLDFLFQRALCQNVESNHGNFTVQCFVYMFKLT